MIEHIIILLFILVSSNIIYFAYLHKNTSEEYRNHTKTGEPVNSNPIKFNKLRQTNDKI